jgi:hypothetical protein
MRPRQRFRDDWASFVKILRKVRDTSASHDGVLEPSPLRGESGMFGIRQQKILDLFAAWGGLCVGCVLQELGGNCRDGQLTLKHLTLLAGPGLPWHVAPAGRDDPTQ